MLMLVALLPCHKYFYRKASLISERFSTAWIASIILVLVGSVWMALFSFKHVEYSNELWWHFSLSGDAPRTLRAMIGAIGLALFFGMARLLRPAPPEPALPTAAELERARIIIERIPESLGESRSFGG